MSKQFKNFDDLPKQFNKDLKKWLSAIKVYDFSIGGTKDLKTSANRFLNSENIFRELN